MRLVIVAAVAANGVIGADGRMPWHYPADLAQFRRRTLGHPVVMGRLTFEAIHRQLGTPLPDRHNIVLTHRPEQFPDTVVAVDGVDAAIEEAASHGADTAYVVGGRSVYEQFLPRVDELVLTELHRAFDGDTTFPAVEWDRWQETERERHDEFDVVTYVRAGTGESSTV
jgi:dihydrofolate reductase